MTSKNLLEVAKALVLEKTLEAQSDPAKAEENITYLATLVVGDSSSDLAAFAQDQVERLEAQRGALALQKLQAEDDCARALDVANGAIAFLADGKPG